MAVELPAAVLADLPSSASAWWVVAIGSIPGAISAVWVAYQFLSNRHDKRASEHLTREERREKDLDEQQAGLTRQASELVTGLRDENKGLRERIIEVERDRNRGWDLARYWHGRAHELLRLFRNLRHDLMNARQVVVSLFRRLPDEPTPAWDAVPDVPVLPMGVEDPK